MTELERLVRQVKVKPLADNKYQVTVQTTWRNLQCISTNKAAWDRINVNENVGEKKKLNGMTLLQAYRAFYVECIDKNN